MTTPADPHAPPEVAASYADRGEAEVARAHLAANGIHAEIIDEAEGGAIPVFGDLGVRVMVPAVDIDAARAVLAGA